MAEEMKKYNQKMGKFNRQFALENLNVKKQADKYLKIYEN
jgi:hypothetical protein